MMNCNKRYIAFYGIVIVDSEWHVLANDTDGAIL